MKKKVIGAALAASTLLMVPPVIAQDGHRGERHERWDRDGRHDRDGRRDRWDRRGDHRRDRDYRRGDRGDRIIGGVIGGLLGGFLLGETHHYRFNYDDNYWGRHGYDRRYYDNWRGRDRGYGCQEVGYGRGCRTIHYDRNFMILNLGGEVYCYRRSYRGWAPAYCPSNWYDY